MKRKEEQHLMQLGVNLNEKKLVYVDKEIFVVAMPRLLLRESVDPVSAEKGFLKKGERVAVRNRQDWPTVPTPTVRLQLARPTAIETLGWVSELNKDGGPTLMPEEPEVPVTTESASVPAQSEAAVSVVPPGGEGGGFAGFFANVGKTLAKLSSAMTLRSLFFGNDIDKSDEGLRKMFDEIDVDHGGSISSDEMGDHVRKMYGESVDDEQVAAMMKAADTDGSGEVDFEEFKRFMRAAPDTRDGDWAKGNPSRVPAARATQAPPSRAKAAAGAGGAKQPGLKLSSVGGAPRRRR